MRPSAFWRGARLGFVLANVLGALPVAVWARWNGLHWMAFVLALAWILACMGLPAAWVNFKDAR